MTLVEFLHPLRDQPLRDIALAALYFERRYSQKEAMTVEQLRAVLRRAHTSGLARANLADILAKAAPYVDATGRQGHRFLWSLTDTGQSHVRSLLGLPEADVEIEHDVSSLEKIVAAIANKQTADYVREAVTCLQVGALRATVVFLWAGAVSRIQQEVIATGTKQINSALDKFDPKHREIKRLSDLEYVKESNLLLVAEAVGVYDRNQRSVLEQALDLRNKCGHPAAYKPGVNKVGSFIEDVASVVFA